MYKVQIATLYLPENLIPFHHRILKTIKIKAKPWSSNISVPDPLFHMLVCDFHLFVQDFISKPYSLRNYLYYKISTLCTKVYFRLTVFLSSVVTKE